MTPTPMREDPARLREIAEAAATSSESYGEWVVADDKEYAGVTAAQDDGVWMAQTGAAGYPAPAARAAHIATFDPPTILLLLARIEELEGALEQVWIAGSDLLIGFSVHNAMDAAAPDRAADIEGPVVDAFSNALHAARSILHGDQSS